MSLTSINGRLLSGINTGLHPRDRGLTLGDGIFETLLVHNRVALWEAEHLSRMAASARALGLVFPTEMIVSGLRQVLEQGGPGPHVLRITLSRGVALRTLASDGKAPTLVITCDPLDLSLTGAPVTLATSVIRRNGHSVSDRHKTLSYVNNIAAAREANAKGCEDALMPTADGNAACTTIANIFAMRDGHLSTPPADAGVLEGVVRGALIKQFGAEIRPVTMMELHEADAVFTTNSLRLIRPVRALDGRALRQGPLKTQHTALLNDIQKQCGALIPVNHSALT